jgi:hypothetical protein
MNDARHKLDKEEEEEEKREDFSKSHADLPGKNADLPGKNADLPSKNADLPGKNADLPGKNADLPGNSADLPGNSAGLPTRITKRNKRITEEKRERNTEITLSAQAQVIYVAWCSLFTVEVPLTQTIARAAQGLVKPVASWCEELHITPAELLRRMMNWLYETDKTGYYKRGVKLYDLEREFEAWQSATERTLRKKSSQRHIPTLAEDPYSIAALIASQNPGYFASQEGAQSTYGE